jgi:transcriptional regulator with XRE-family HTH domain
MKRNEFPALRKGRFGIPYAPISEWQSNRIQMSMSDNLVGTKLRQLREDRQLSVDDLAGQSEVSAGMIEQIEAGLNIPSLTPLLRIAKGMGVRLGSLLDHQANPGPVYVPAGQGREIARFSANWNHQSNGNGILRFASLAPDKKDRHMEPFIIDVQPEGQEDPAPPLSAHDGEEFIYVLQGNIQLSYGNDTYSLSAGDSIYYDSVVPHNLHALGQEPAKILAVVYTSSQ